MPSRKQFALLTLSLVCACRATTSVASAPAVATTTHATSAPITPVRATESTPNTGLFGTYDENNAFARIIRGELPSSKVYEDEHVLAFMPLRMITPGHVVVISKTSRARNILEIEPEELARVMDVVTRVARAEIKALGIQGFQILQNNGAVGTQSVFHLHVHVLPRYPGVDLLPASGPQNTRAELDSMARLIKAAMK